MPPYMLLIYPPTEGERPGSDDPAAELSRWQDFNDSLRDAGVLLGSGRLHGTEAATTVRVRDGETLVVDGPFAETKEYLAGYYLIDCADLDSALAHAARMPGAAYGSIEVRPMMYPANTPAGAMDR